MAIKINDYIKLNDHHFYLRKSKGAQPAGTEVPTGHTIPQPTPKVPISGSAYPRASSLSLLALDEEQQEKCKKEK